MGWRKIEKDDIKRGTIIRLTNLMRDGGYATATIIAVHDGTPTDYHIKVARPYAYAHHDFDDDQPLLGCEVFTLGIQSVLDGTYVEVFQAAGGVRQMTT